MLVSFKFGSFGPHFCKLVFGAVSLL
uniref:Uncharacterized protein n=1 Tax=Arundo donax TaxID=35708 RepID=A0A0A8ZI84_ARUDO